MLEDMVFTHENSSRKEALVGQGLTYGHDFDFCGLALRVVKADVPLEKLLEKNGETMFELRVLDQDLLERRRSPKFHSSRFGR